MSFRFLKLEGIESLQGPKIPSSNPDKLNRTDCNASILVFAIDTSPTRWHNCDGCMSVNPYLGVLSVGNQPTGVRTKKCSAMLINGKYDFVSRMFRGTLLGQHLHATVSSSRPLVKTRPSKALCRQACPLDPRQ